MSPLKIASRSHIGLVRKNNQDRILHAEIAEDTYIIAVADGLGGTSGGEIAAELCIDTIKYAEVENPLSSYHLISLIQKAQLNVLDYGKTQKADFDMGSTLTLALLQKSQVHWAHVGDSRIYHYKKIEKKYALFQVSRDHRFLTELVEHGDISAEAAAQHPFRNVLEQCVGCPDLKPDSGSFSLDPGDSLLLCSDGLYDNNRLESLEEILRKERDTEKKAEQLLDLALKAGGKDNISLIVLDYNP